jgi:AcrR family transcriptional regulator
MTKINKDGQAIGRKGSETRTRLLDAARFLIATMSVEKVTASGIARAASLASQTFYLYFDDVDEVLLHLSREAALDTGEIVAELDRPWTSDATREHAERFVSAFYQYWDKHRAILNIRNFRADGGQEPFTQIRNDSAMPIVNRIADRIRKAQGEATVSDRDALARAVIVYSAIERMAARYASLHFVSDMLNSDDLKRAETEILTLLLSPPQGR